jgi:hypothetical protein
MNKILIDRELLERAVYRLELAYDADTPIVCDLSSVLSTPSGTPAMPVKAYYHEAPNEYGGLNKSVGLEVRKEFTDAPLVLESDATAIIDGLRGEVELLVSQKAEWVERATVLGQKADQQAQRIGELEGLLWEACQTFKSYFPGENPPAHNAMIKRIDTALSAGKEGE